MPSALTRSKPPRKHKPSAASASGDGAHFIYRRQPQELPHPQPLDVPQRFVLPQVQPTLLALTLPVLQADAVGNSGREKNSVQTLSANSSAGGIAQ